VVAMWTHFDLDLRGEVTDAARGAFIGGYDVPVAVAIELRGACDKSLNRAPGAPLSFTFGMPLL
jgi:hypothetical protein